ncbi:hypothetical protein BDN72DRAFT_862141 [Pluteus cervinus]|uniref:Uncharacterized protein n=1 Tax=Pluteus cervinus TaxID=181527 RepID=A0ACD3ACS5_9AGAR|nr:hypothetical protein BDN72DRAFT_862141 [Pluteus cervinus]
MAAHTAPIYMPPLVACRLDDRLPVRLIRARKIEEESWGDALSLCNPSTREVHFGQTENNFETEGLDWKHFLARQTPSGADNLADNQVLVVTIWPTVKFWGSDLADSQFLGVSICPTTKISWQLFRRQPNSRGDDLPDSENLVATISPTAKFPWRRFARLPDPRLALLKSFPSALGESVLTSDTQRCDTCTELRKTWMAFPISNPRHSVTRRVLSDSDAQWQYFRFLVPYALRADKMGQKNSFTRLAFDAYQDRFPAVISNEKNKRVRDTIFKSSPIDFTKTFRWRVTLAQYIHWGVPREAQWITWIQFFDLHEDRQRRRIYWFEVLGGSGIAIIHPQYEIAFQGHPSYAIYTRYAQEDSNWI